MVNGDLRGICIYINGDLLNIHLPKLDEVSVYYRKISNVLTVRLIRDEYLIAMKLRSGRKYKNDLSDIIGVLAEHESNHVT